jgi:hypothetical protein
MKTRYSSFLVVLALLAGFQQAAAQGTTFAYQGSLSASGAPANGFYDFEFTLYPNADGSGSKIGSAVTQTNLGVTNGMFLTTLDFGAVFAGDDTWLEISVRSNRTGSYTTLTPLQELTPTPYAIFANTASNLSGTLATTRLSGTVPLAQLPGAVITNDQGSVTLSNVTVSGDLTLPLPAIVNAGGNSLFIAPQNNNFYAGPSAGVSDGTGGANTGLGAGSLQSNANGTNNTGAGYDTLAKNTTGSDNTGAGDRALYSNTGGNDNTAVGHRAMYNNLLGNDNTASGYLALSALTNGVQNTVTGSSALAALTGGSNNTVLGYLAGNNYGGQESGNILVGSPGVGGDNNTIRIGSSQSQTFIAGMINGNGGGLTNVPAGKLSGTLPLAQLPAGILTNNESSVTLSNINLTGVIKGNGSGLSNLVFSSAAANLSLSNMTLGGQLTLPLPAVIGCDFPFIFSEATNHVLLADTLFNFSAGVFAGNLAMTGSGNAGVGTFALFANTSGNANGALGLYALANNTTGSSNTAVGAYALQNNTGGTQNTAVGAGALTANDGIWNTAVGADALAIDTDALGNTAIGYQALENLTNGFSDIALGINAGSTLGEGYGDIYIGNDGAADEDDTIRLGYAQAQTYIAGNVCLGGASPQQTLNIDGGIAVDQSGQNIGTVANAITFGSGSGEGIGSIRTLGYADSFGLNFYTDYADRMTILQHGNVGINTTNPTTQLEVNGEYLQVDGLGGVKCYLGDDGSGNDVQLGSQKSGITEIGFYNTADAAYMHINCSSITIKGGADLAEPFPMSHSPETIAPGDVVVIDVNNPGQLKLSHQAYDPRVAGVVSGANGVHPGIQMLQEGVLDSGKNVALSGRVYVQADASNGPIAPGDLLTTSGAPGYAMKVTDRARAQGAILGKAMTGLASGKGQVLTLVTLQ